MRVVYKYPFTVHDEVVIAMHRDARVLLVEHQWATPCIWAEVDTSEPVQPYYFRVFGTGHEIPEGFSGRHFASFRRHDGRFVWHMYQTT